MRIYTSFGAVYSLIQRGIIKKSSEIGPTLEAAGLHGLEFNPCILEISPRYAPGFSFSPAELKDIPLSLHSNYVNFNLGSLNPFIRKAAIEQLKAEIRLAGEWNIPVLTIHPGWVRKIKRELAMEFFWDSLAAFLENLEPTAPIICLENMDHRPHKLCNTAEEISKTLERFPALKLTVDFAHRGDSLHFPENTIPAFLAAVEAGADLIEFDLRASRDKIPVVIHDRKVDRISSGSSPVGAYSLKELKQLDFLPAGKAQKIRIPTFEEVLKTLPDTIGLNIQVKETENVLLEKICSLVDCYQLYRRAYLTLSTFADAELVRQINSRIELCVLERKRPLDLVLLKEMKNFGCKFLQPHRRDVTPELCLQIDKLGFYANMYFSNTVEDHHHFITAGVRGIITDDPALLVQTLKNMDRYTGSAG